VSCVLHYTQQTLPLMIPVFRFLNFILLTNPISPVFSFALNGVAHSITQPHYTTATAQHKDVPPVVRIYSSTSHAYWLQITSLNGVLLLVGCFLSPRVRFVELRLKCNGTRAETRFLLSTKRTSPFQ